jgi:hypothetical protein
VRDRRLKLESEKVNMTTTTNVSPPAGTTTIDSDLKIEVEILALAALRRIASDIARRIEGLIKDQNPRPGIVIIRDDHFEDLAKSRVLSAELKYLEDTINALPTTATAEVATNKNATDTTKERSAYLLPFISATDTVQAIANLLALFKVDTEYKGRTVSLDETALHPAIGGQLLALGIEAAQANGLSLRVKDPILDQLKKIIELRAKMVLPEYAGDKKAQVEAVLRAFDSLMQKIAKRDGDYHLPRLSTAGKLDELMTSDPRPFVLTAKVLKAGGRYKIRKHLFTTLFWGDQLSYGGGATVAFSLFDPGTWKVVLSDVLFHLTQDVKFSEGDATVSSASNLLTSEASGTEPLALLPPRQLVAVTHSAGEPVGPNSGDISRRTLT